MNRKWSSPSRLPGTLALAGALTLSGCSRHTEPATPSGPATPATPKVSPFHVDPATAGALKGTVRTDGHAPAPRPIDMSEDPACVKAHHGKAVDESLLVNRHGEVENAFVYIKSGLEGKAFEVPQTPVTIDQAGCMFHPRVLGIQVDQILKVVNSDPVTHNIHPMAEINREWNHSQGPGDPPIDRHFTKPEVMVPVKCNIHSWMHAYVGVLSHPYFAVTKADGSFEIGNLPPGTYTLALWQEKLGTKEQSITIQPHGNTVANFEFKGK